MDHRGSAQPRSDSRPRRREWREQFWQECRRSGGRPRWQRSRSPCGISQYRVAKDTCVPPRRINEIVHGKRSVTADTALRLATFFGTTPEFWLNLQTLFDLATLRDSVGAEIEATVKPLTR